MQILILKCYTMETIKCSFICLTQHLKPVHHQVFGKGGNTTCFEYINTMQNSKVHRLMFRGPHTTAFYLH